MFSIFGEYTFVSSNETKFETTKRLVVYFLKVQVKNVKVKKIHQNALLCFLILTQNQILADLVGNNMPFFLVLLSSDVLMPATPRRRHPVS